MTDRPIQLCGNVRLNISSGVHDPQNTGQSGNRIFLTLTHDGEIANPTLPFLTLTHDGEIANPTLPSGLAASTGKLFVQVYRCSGIWLN